MKLSVFNAALGAFSLEDACRFLRDNGVQTIEMGCGGYPGKKHCNPKALLGDPKQLAAFRATLAEYGMEIGALSVHGNPVHPDPAQARMYHDDFVDAVLLAEALNVGRVVTFSGCPGGSAQDLMPNWVTCAWPNEYQQVLEYQWNEVLIPYWKQTAAFALEHGVRKIALEMHPGFCVYNPETLLKLRHATSDVIGANLDPSHLFWQGIDPVMAVRELGDAVHFFHAKDTKLDAANIARNGVLDLKSYQKIQDRSWTFRTVGYGHDLLTWNSIFSELRKVGYDDVISIEHEDGLMSGGEGMRKAIAFLKQALMFESPGEMFWA